MAVDSAIRPPRLTVMNLTPVFASVLAAEIAPIDYGKVFGACFLAVTLVALIAFSLRGLWLIFEKAGVEGWKAVIPVYHHVILTRLAGLSAWWTLPLLLVLPFLKAQDKGAKLLCLLLLFLWCLPPSAAANATASASATAAVRAIACSLS